jgi:hypothetical protein
MPTERFLTKSAIAWLKPFQLEELFQERSETPTDDMTEQDFEGFTIWDD